jgi:hypothetical protein
MRIKEQEIILCFNNKLSNGKDVSNDVQYGLHVDENCVGFKRSLN